MLRLLKLEGYILKYAFPNPANTPGKTSGIDSVITAAGGG